MWFDLPFFVPEMEKWGDQEWPPMRLEVSFSATGKSVLCVHLKRCATPHKNGDNDIRS